MGEITGVAQIDVTPEKEVLNLIDERLISLMNRQLVSASEISDFLLDIRAMLVKQNHKGQIDIPK